jgi:hypothetical protein
VRHPVGAECLAINSGSFLADACAILTEWTSKGFMKRLWSHGDFKGIADSIDRKLDTFRDVFSVWVPLDQFLF